MSSAKLRTSSGTAAAAAYVAGRGLSAHGAQASRFPASRAARWLSTRAAWSPVISCWPDSYWFWWHSCSAGSTAFGAGRWLPGSHSSSWACHGERAGHGARSRASVVAGGETATSLTTSPSRRPSRSGGDDANVRLPLPWHSLPEPRSLVALIAGLTFLAAACGGGSSEAPPVELEDQPIVQTPAPPTDEPATEAEPVAESEPNETPTPEPDPPSQPAPNPEPNIVEPSAGVDPLPFDFEHALEVLQQLAVEIGPRVKATAGEREAAEYIAAQLVSFGYEVELQPVPLLLSNVGEATLTVGGQPIPARAFAGSAGGAAVGSLVVVQGLGAQSDYAGLDVTGAVVLVERGDLFFQQKAANAQAAGAAAIVIYNNDPGPFDGGLSTGITIPALAIAREDGLALASASGAPAAVEVKGRSETRESLNVIARTTGGRCEIYVGGHYDTVPDVPGANDNASGTALVVELARAYRGSAGSEFVCFVAFGAEEGGGGGQGIDGSRFLAAQIQASGEAGQVRAMLNLDLAADGTDIVLIGSSDLTAMGLPLAQSLPSSESVGTLPPGSGSDHLSFDAIGIPVVFPSVRGAVIHVPSDNFTNVDTALFADMGMLAHGLLRCLIAQKGRVPLSGEACLALNTAA